MYYTDVEGNNIYMYVCVWKAANGNGTVQRRGELTNRVQCYQSTEETTNLGKVHMYIHEVQVVIIISREEPINQSKLRL